MSDLKTQLIKLGATNPELRPHIRPLLKVANKYSGGRFLGSDIPGRKPLEDRHNKLYRSEDDPYVSVFADREKVVVPALEKEIKKIIKGVKTRIADKGNDVHVLLENGTEWRISPYTSRGYLESHFTVVKDNRVGDKAEYGIDLVYPDVEVDLKKYTPAGVSSYNNFPVKDFLHDLVPKRAIEDMAKDFKEILRIDEEEERRIVEFEQEHPERIRSTSQLMQDFIKKLNLKDAKRTMMRADHVQIDLSDGSMLAVSFHTQKETSFQVFYRMIRTPEGKNIEQKWLSVNSVFYKKNEMTKAAQAFTKEITRFLSMGGKHDLEYIAEAIAKGAERLKGITKADAAFSARPPSNGVVFLYTKGAKWRMWVEQGDKIGNYKIKIVLDLGNYGLFEEFSGIYDHDLLNPSKSVVKVVKDFQKNVLKPHLEKQKKEEEEERKKQEEVKREQAKPGDFTFSQYESGTDANQLFRRMQKEDKEEADYERNQDMWGDQSNSGGGWTGPKPTHIYQKRGFEIVGEAESDREAYMMAEKMLKKNPLRGPAWAIEVKRNGRTEGFRFFGTL